MTEPQPSSPSQQPANANGLQEHQSSIPPPSAQPQTSTETTETAIKPEPDLDASIEQDIDMNAEQSGAGAEESGAGALATEVDQLAESSQPSKKETSLREFLGKMDEYAPIVSAPRVSSL
jgi:transcription initiation factor TFIID subunit 10